MIRRARLFIRLLAWVRVNGGVTRATLYRRLLGTCRTNNDPTWASSMRRNAGKDRRTVQKRFAVRPEIRAPKSVRERSRNVRMESTEATTRKGTRVNRRKMLQPRFKPSTVATKLGANFARFERVAPRSDRKREESLSYWAPDMAIIPINLKRNRSDFP